jgi:two-component system cell cycle sensor histidine kinase/response regulator CckA
MSATQNPAGQTAAAASGAAGAAEHRYRALFEDALVGIHVSLPDGTLVDCNPAFARMLGFDSTAAAIGRDLTAIHGSGAPETWLDALRRQGRVEHQRGYLCRPDGRHLRVMSSAVGVFDRTGTLIEIRGFVVDITHSVEAEDELKDRERRFRAVFVDAADAMLILDDNRRVIDANRAAGVVFGEAPEALTGQVLDDFIASEDREQLEAGWRELLAFGEAKREHHVVSNRRPHRLVECSYRAAVHGRRHLCNARDITDRRLLEDRLVQSEKIESIGRLAGGIAHDFNNLLTAILGYTELLLSQRGPDDPDRLDLEEIQKAGQRAAALTQRLLAYSRKQVLVPKEVDLNQAIGNLRGVLSRLIRADISLTCVTSDAPVLIKIDPTQLEQVVINLALNARDALPAGGAIRVTVARVRLSEVEVPSDHPTRAGEYARLTVTDNGVGMSPEARAHLFEPFFTTKEMGKGTGLGLASVYGIVRQSNGFIGVETAVGKGTTFTMHFPILSGAIPAAAGPSSGYPAVVGCETILLVEDEDSVRVIIGAVLRRHGYHVLEAATPREACDLFAAHGPEIDLLLSDVVMPEMNGPALAQRLVAVRPDLRILFISGHADGASPIDGSSPHVSFLGKPFQASVLANKVRDMLSTRAGPACWAATTAHNRATAGDR